MNMATDNIEKILEKYFEGESTIAEENDLQTYFLSSNVAQHLTQYAPLFKFYDDEKFIERKHKLRPALQQRNIALLSIAASAVILISVGTFLFYNNETPKSTAYGTFETPEKAFEETQKALNLLSENVNVGVQSVQYINEFENSKNKIFKTN